MLPSKTSAHHFNSKIKFDIAVNCAWCVDWVFHSWSENTEEFSILGLNVPNSPYHYLLLLVKVMIHISSLSRSFYIRHITEITLLSWLFSCSIMSNFLGPSGLQHNRLCCASVSHRDYPSSCPQNRWRHPTISTSVALFSFSLQSFPASGSFPMSQLLTSGGQSIGASVLAPVLPMNIQGWFPLGLTGLFSLLCKGLSRVLPTC